MNVTYSILICILKHLNVSDFLSDLNNFLEICIFNCVIIIVTLFWYDYDTINKYKLILGIAVFSDVCCVSCLLSIGQVSCELE